MRTRPPRFAEHGDAILAEHGYTEAEVAGLHGAGVLHTERRR